MAHLLVELNGAHIDAIEPFPILIDDVWLIDMQEFEPWGGGRQGVRALSKVANMNTHAVCSCSVPLFPEDTVY